jgi:hypothetical protein
VIVLLDIRGEGDYDQNHYRVGVIGSNETAATD